VCTSCYTDLITLIAAALWEHEDAYEWICWKTVGAEGASVGRDEDDESVGVEVVGAATDDESGGVEVVSQRAKVEV
jgi:hypothetical protein